MSTVLPKRRLIPKWRKSIVTLGNEEAKSLQQRPPTDISGKYDELNQAIDLWKQYRQPGLLGEVLSFSFHPEMNQQIVEIGREAIKSGSVISQTQKFFINDLINEGETFGSLLELPALYGHDHPFQAPMMRLRSILKTAPGNILALLDYAQLQAALGKEKSAERALRTALQLAPNNRVVLRTVARFFVHIRQKDRAHRLISRHQLTPHDPWLLASEIALAEVAGETSKLINKGRRLLSNQNLSVTHTTELAGAIAGIELESGHYKIAREMQRRALTAPNDNVIAQAIDQEKEFGLYLEGDQIERAIASSNEAQMLSALGKIDPIGVESFAKQWHEDEPFSSRPIHVLSVVLAHKGDTKQAIEWIKAGLLSDSKDSGLLINLAYAQALSDQIEPARDTLHKLRSLNISTVEPFTIATEGLIAYKQGQYQMGDIIYDNAVSIFARTGRDAVAAFCRVNQAFAAIELGHPQYERIVSLAKAALINNGSTDSAMMIKIKNSEYVRDIKTDKKELRHMAAWELDISANTITKKKSISKIGGEKFEFIQKK